MRRSFSVVAAASLLAASACAHNATSAHHDHGAHGTASTDAVVPAADAAATAKETPLEVSALDTAAIDKATGLQGRAVGKRVYRVDLPRPELKVSADGAPIDGGMLPTWATFQPIDAKTTMMMADVTLVENQVNPIIKLAHDQGFTVSALHNHYLWESPRLMFMHFEGMGDARTMAEGIGVIFKQLQSLPDPARKKIPLVTNSKAQFDADAINAILGQKGAVRNGRYALAIDRPVVMHGHEVAPGMMMGSIIVLIGSPEMAYTTGDIAVVDAELTPVLKSLLASNIEVVSIHNHMTSENPRYFYIHFWGSRPADELARELKKALDLTAH